MNKFNNIAIILILSCRIGYGQISTEEDPVSFSLELPALRSGERTHKVMPSIDLNRMEQEDREREASGKPFRFGYRHEVNFTLENSGEWMDLPDGGGRLWRLDISCPSALSINLMYDQFWLPKGAKLWVYSADRKRCIGAFTSANNNGDNKDMLGFSTTLVAGERCVLEYWLPYKASETGVITVSSVIHGYKNMVALENSSRYTCSSCSVNWPIDTMKNYIDERNAVAMIVYGGECLCSGALINNTLGDKRPLFLTADHCVDSYINLDQLLFYWHFDNICDLSKAPSRQGAQRCASDSNSDFLLLELNEDPYLPPPIPKVGAPVAPLYYLGWDRTGTPGSGGAGIHHPKGDLKKISTYNHVPNGNGCKGSNFWQITWSTGRTQPGSSGSPLLDNNKRVIGQLYGVCPNADPDNCNNSIANYGKFNDSWAGGGATNNSLWKWLAPNASSATNAPNFINGLKITAADRPYISSSTTIVCTTGDIFTLNNPPYGTITWAIENDNNGLFQITNPTSNQVTVKKIGNGNGSATLVAKKGNQVAATTSITACISPTITGSTFTDIQYSGSNFTLVNAPSGTVTWTVTGPFMFKNNINTGNPVTVCRTGSDTGSGVLKAFIGAQEQARVTITPCAPVNINGNDYVYSTATYTLSIADANTTWTLTPVFPTTPVFNLVNNTGPTATVTVPAGQPYQSAYLRANVNGPIIEKYILTSAINGVPTVCSSGSFNLTTLESASWSLTNGANLFSLATFDNNTRAEVISLGPAGQTCTLQAVVNLPNNVTRTHTMNIQSCLATLIGPTNVCNTSSPVTYNFGGFGGAMSWSVYPGDRFDVVSYTATSCTLKALLNDGLNGAVVAFTPGGVVSKTIYATCAKGGSDGNNINLDAYVTAFPNPVSTSLYVEIDAAAHVKDLQSKSARTTPTYEIFLYDRLGDMVRQQKTKDGRVEFNISNLTNGVYYLLVFDELGSTPATRQIVVEH